MPDPDFMTSQEAADWLGYTRQHVRRLIRWGRLAGQKLGRDWIVRRDSVQALAADRENLLLALQLDSPLSDSQPRVST